MMFFFWDVWQNSGKSFVDNGGGNVAVAATLCPFIAAYPGRFMLKQCSWVAGWAEESAFGSA